MTYSVYDRPNSLYGMEFPVPESLRLGPCALEAAIRRELPPENAEDHLILDILGVEDDHHLGRRHAPHVEFRVNARRAEAAVARIQSIFDRLVQAVS